MLKPIEMRQAPKIRPLINIGSLMDVITGFYVKGVHNENILVGGLGQITGLVGIGNSFKSTILHYMMLSAADKISYATDTAMITYDTESNMQSDRLQTMLDRFDHISEKDPLNNGGWVVTDKSTYHGEVWYDELKKYLKEKTKDSKDHTYRTPFSDRDNEEISIMTPTFTEIDSLSEFETSDVYKIQDENMLGESGANMLYARAALAKNRLLGELPHLASSSSNYFLMTAHLGSEMALAGSQYQAQPLKKLQHIGVGKKVKGVSDKLYFLTSNFWMAVDAKPYMNQGTKSPEYPKDSTETTDQGNVDLNIVTLKLLRTKTGRSGSSIELLVSQSEGVLPTLSEFHYIKSQDRFGMIGNVQNYGIVLYPDAKLSRTTIRTKIDADSKLRRAINITSELCQLHQYHRGSMSDILCTPEQLYEDITKKGYSWDMILGETRGWWTLNNDQGDLKFLSTKDLLEMRLGLYEPFWFKT